jgi:hypothetical protein
MRVTGWQRPVTISAVTFLIRTWPLALALLVAAGCCKPADSSAAPAPTVMVTAAPATTWTPPSDASGAQACDEIKRVNAELLAAGKVYEADPDVMARIGGLAAQSTNRSVAIRGLLLGDFAKLAKAAKAERDKLETQLGMSTRATELETACITGRYYRPL